MIRHQRGFTLLELMAALVITMALLTVALPGFEAQQYRVERVQALQGLQAAARCHAAQRAIRGQVDPSRCVPPASPRYRFFLVPAQGGLDAGHEWRAEPQDAQRGDPCGTLVLDHLGQKSVLGTPARAVACWRGR